MARSFYEISGINYSVSKVEDGNLDFRFDKEEMVRKNRQAFFAKNEYDLDKSIWMKLAHDDQTAIVGENNTGRGKSSYQDAIEADAFLTNEKGIFLSMLTADCFPLGLYDPVKQVIGLVHLGWKGVDLDLTKKTVGRMREQFGSETKDILVNIGPGIRKQSYLYPDPAQKEMPKWVPYLEEKEDGLTSIDLVSFIKNQLKELGIVAENIFDEEEDTAQNENYYSHYRSVKEDAKEGRFATILGLR